MTDIPEDVMKAARSAATTRLFSDRADKQADELTRHISRAIMAERERCAVVCDEWNDMKHVAYDLEFNGKLFPKKSPVHEALATAIRKGTTP